MRELFQPHRTRLNPTLLRDAVRALLSSTGLPTADVERLVAPWVTMAAAVESSSHGGDVVDQGFRLGALHTPCRILDGDGDRAIGEERTPSPRRNNSIASSVTGPLRECGTSPVGIRTVSPISFDRVSV